MICTQVSTALCRVPFYWVGGGLLLCGVCAHPPGTIYIYILGGFLANNKLVFLRTLSLHLQICWQAVPGRRFFLAAQAAGWSVPVVFLAVALSVTGVSFRFGESCHINSKNGLETFWGPLLAVAAASIVTQAITFAPFTKYIFNIN